MNHIIYRNGAALIQMSGGVIVEDLVIGIVVLKVGIAISLWLLFHYNA